MQPELFLINHRITMTDKFVYTHCRVVVWYHGWVLWYIVENHTCVFGILYFSCYRGQAGN